jgi:hypothetical protein
VHRHARRLGYNMDTARAEAGHPKPARRPALKPKPPISNGHQADQTRPAAIFLMGKCRDHALLEGRCVVPVGLVCSSSLLIRWAQRLAVRQKLTYRPVQISGPGSVVAGKVQVRRAC